MKKYWVYFKMQWQATLEYRGDVVLYALSSALLPLMGLFVWLAVSSSGANLAFSNSEIIIYFLLVTLVNSVTSTWGSWYVLGKINDGSFSNYLVKPFSIVDDFAINNIAEKAFKLIVLSIFALIAGFFLLRGSSLSFSVSWLQIILFILSLGLAAVLTFLLDMIIGLSTFWIYEIDFINSLFMLASSLLAGKVIPVAFLPDFLKNWVTYLPFRYTVSFPIEILMNKMPGSDLISGLTIQIFWLIFTFVGYKFLFAKGSKKYQGYGA